MTIPQDLRILAETDNYILGNVHEYGSIIDKRNGIETYIGDSYGNPDFGLIDKNENWAMLFGNDSYLWTPAEILNLNIELFNVDGIFQWPFDARQINDLEVEILNDPWSDNSGVYNFNIKTKVVQRVRNFKKVTIPYEAYNKPKIAW